MSDKTTPDQNANWPIPAFHFQVSIGATKFSFSEISGLDMETEPIEYRHGNAKDFQAMKMPGINKSGLATMKRGLLLGDTDYRTWSAQLELTSRIPQRQTVQIDLLDESGKPTMRWNLHNAWVSKVTGTDLKADGNEVAIESLELAFETMEIVTP